MELTSMQWSAISRPFPEGKSGKGKRGRPRRGNREILEGILWILRTGARWCDLPDHFTPCQTCHRRFSEWVREGVLNEVLQQ